MNDEDSVQFLTTESSNNDESFVSERAFVFFSRMQMNYTRCGQKVSMLKQNSSTHKQTKNLLSFFFLCTRCVQKVSRLKQNLPREK